MAIFQANNNDGFKWHCYGNVFVKGYAFDKSQNYFEGEHLAHLFENTNSAETLKSLTASLNGLFCAMGELPWGEFALVDKCRTFPLFYANTGNKTVISDNPYSIKETNVIREDSIASYMSTGYVTGNRTLFEEIFPVPPFSILIISKNKQSIFEYYTYATPTLIDVPFDVATNQLHCILDQAMARMVNTLNNRPVAIPLSGGYDSRFILTWLVTHDYKNVVAFSYGKEGNPDAKVAEKVARQLGVKWIPVFYSKALIDGFTSDPNFLPFCHYMSAATSMPFMQDYFAIKELVRRDLLLPGTIIIPGHSGDFIAGSHICPSVNSNWSSSEVVNEIFNHHNTTNPITKKQIVEEKKLIRQLIDQIEGLPFTLIENYNFKERQAKFIINSTRAYSYFGLEYRLPLWDSDLLAFFKKTPLDFRLNKKLYDKVLQQHYFTPMNVNFVNQEMQQVKESNFDKTKRWLKRLLPVWILKIKPMPDYLNYGLITRRLYKESNMPKPTNLGRSRNAGITYWYLHTLIEIFTNRK